MAAFKIAAKNQFDIEKKSRVYFTCHPDDFEKYFKKICDDIFKTHDCAVYYTSDMTEAIADDEKEVDLGRNNLFVVPVTYRLLSTPNRAMDKDIPYAFQKHIPVLPIMMESGIDNYYSNRDKFGALQYLNPYSTDATEISYEEKLKKYLDSVLISDELAKRVRAAFDAYIFLSYRKKDRKYANELMKMIHNNPECRDIAIWFDEFLTPGESFKESIEKILDDCKLFTLLVTPHLLEKVVDEKGEERDNYVISTELPLARKKKEEKGTDIFAVEMEDTDKEELSSINIREYVNSKDDAFRARLLDAISKIAIAENNTPEHKFLIGLAYLDGIDVEVDRTRAVKLISSAAEEGVPEAMLKLYDMYSSGIGTNINYHMAEYWAEKAVAYYTTKYGEENVNTIEAIGNHALACQSAGYVHKALQLSEKVYILSCNTLGKEHTYTLASLGNLAVSYAVMGNLQKSLELSEKVYNQYYAKYGEEHPYTLISLNCLADAYGAVGNLQMSMELSKKVYRLSGVILGEEHHNTLAAANSLTTAYCRINEFQKAYELSEKAYNISCRVLGEEHLHTMILLSNFAYTCGKTGNLSKALELNEKLFKLRCRVLGGDHPDTLTSINNLAMDYSRIGDFKKALKLSDEACYISCNMLGEDHPDSLICLSNLAYICGELGDMQTAFDVREKVYNLSVKALGEEHPSTFVYQINLAESYAKLGNASKALEVLENLYEKQCRVFGEGNAETVETLEILIIVSKLAGDRKAKKFYKNKLKETKK